MATHKQIQEKLKELDRKRKYIINELEQSKLELKVINNRLHKLYQLICTEDYKYICSPNTIYEAGNCSDLSLYYCQKAIDALSKDKLNGE